jgi:hypothetical protein
MTTLPATQPRTAFCDFTPIKSADPAPVTLADLENFIDANIHLILCSPRVAGTRHDERENEQVCEDRQVRPLPPDHSEFESPSCRTILCSTSLAPPVPAESQATKKRRVQRSRGLMPATAFNVHAEE